MYYDRKLKLLELPKEISDKLVTPGLQITEKHCRHICKLLNKDKLLGNLPKSMEKEQHIILTNCNY